MFLYFLYSKNSKWKGQQFCLLRQFCEIVVFAASVMPFPSWMQSSQECGSQIDLFAVELCTVFFPGLAFHFRIDSAALWIGSERATEEKNVGFGAVESFGGEKSRLHTNRTCECDVALIVLTQNEPILSDLPVNGIVLPSSTLLDTNSSPFGFRQETALRKRLRKLLWKNDVTSK